MNIGLSEVRKRMNESANEARRKMNKKIRDNASEFYKNKMKERNMRIWTSSNDEEEIKRKKDELDSQDFAIFYENKKEEKITGIKTSVYKNKDGVYELWIGKK